MRISSRWLTAGLVFTCTTTTLAQSFASGLQGTWEGGYCGNSTTTFRFSTRTPQRSWVTERWCNAFTCGNLDYEITEINPASRSFTVHALEGTAFASGGFDIYFQVTADGTSMTGTYVGHPRCQGSQLTRVSTDPGTGPLLATSVAPLPGADRAGVRPANIPPGLTRGSLTDESGSRSCLVLARDEETADDHDDYGRYVTTHVVGSTEWVYNRCTRATRYSMPARGNTRSQVNIASGDTQRWVCTYRAVYTPFLGASTEVAYCDRR